jgi:hypothetical protein
MGMATIIHTGRIMGTITITIMGIIPIPTPTILWDR